MASLSTSRRPSTSCSSPLRTKSILPLFSMEPDTSTDTARFSGGRMAGSATRFEFSPRCSMVQLLPLATAGRGQLGVVLGEEAGGVEVLHLGNAVLGQQAPVEPEVLGAAQADVGVAGRAGRKAAAAAAARAHAARAGAQGAAAAAAAAAAGGAAAGEGADARVVAAW